MVWYEFPKILIVRKKHMVNEFRGSGLVRELEGIPVVDSEMKK